MTTENNLEYLKHKEKTKYAEYIIRQINAIKSELPEFMITEKIYDVDKAMIAFLDKGYLKKLVEKVNLDYKKWAEIDREYSKETELNYTNLRSELCKNLKENILREIQQKGGRPYIIKTSDKYPKNTERQTSIENVVLKLNPENTRYSNFAALIIKYGYSYNKNAEVYIPSKNRSVDLHSILSIIGNLEEIITEKKGFTINVEGEDKESENIALTLYSSFTDEDYKNAGKNRYKE